MDQEAMERSITIARRMALEYSGKCKAMESILSDWLKFASDVKCNDMAGNDWLETLIKNTKDAITS